MAGDMFLCMACPSSPTFLRFTEVDHHLEEVHGVRGVLGGPATRAVLLPSTLASHQCLLCGKGGWLEEEQVQEHMGAVHGEFFTRRWEEYSTSTCRVCGEGVAGVEHHTALHHPRGKFARAGKVVVKEKDNSIKTEKKNKSKMEEAKEPNAVTRKEGKVEVNVKKKEKVKTEKTEQSKRKLEEVTELGAVTRMPGETRVRLTRGEADLVLGRDAKIVIALKRRTGTKISIKGASGDKKREMVITGEDKLVSLAEEEAVKVLMSNTSITMKLKTQETMCLMGVGGRDIEKLQDISGAKITTETNSSTAKLNEVIISGTPEAVATAKSIIKDFLSTGQVIEVTKRQFRILMGRGGWKVREMQDSTGAVIETGGETEEDSEVREITIYGSDEAKEKALQSIYDLFRKLGV